MNNKAHLRPQDFDNNGDIIPMACKEEKGEWIDHSEEGYVECPFCGHLTNCDGDKDELHYCWHCGAKMGKGGAE